MNRYLKKKKKKKKKKGKGLDQQTAQVDHPSLVGVACPASGVAASIVAGPRTGGS